MYHIEIKNLENCSHFKNHIYVRLYLNPLLPTSNDDVIICVNRLHNSPIVWQPLIICLDEVLILVSGLINKSLLFEIEQFIKFTNGIFLVLFV